MIFNFGENPTMDVVRMLMHYAVIQQSNLEQQHANTTPKKLATIPNKNNDTIKDGPRRLHVTNLPFKIRDNELRAMFEVYGIVSDAEIIYNERGSKGFGFVTMQNVEDASKAREALNGKEMDGRKIEVNNATPRSNPAKGAIRPLKHRTALNSSVVAPSTAVVRVPVVPAPNYTTNWNPNRFNCLTTISNNQYSPPPPPQLINAPVAFTATNTSPLTGYTCYPTPEEYAQYYNYLSNHGPFRNNYQNIGGSFGNYRYQPY